MTAAVDDVSRLLQAVRRSRGLVFDFDGTLVDSNDIKRDAFDVCFAEFPDRMAEIRAYCRAFNHTPRWEKFRYVYESILGKSYTAEIDKLLHDRYAAATTQQVISAPEIPGAGDFLRQLPKESWKALISSTPDAIVKRILQERGWGDVFNSVRGAPVRKAAWILESGVEAQGIPAKDILFFGDTAEDLESAGEAGCRFVGVANEALRKDSDHFILNFISLTSVREGKSLEGKP